MSIVYTGDVLERFWSKVNKQGPYPKKQSYKVHPEIKGTKCWEWTASCLANGYAVFSLRQGDKIVSFKAYRFSYELKHGSLGTLHCLHKCDNKKCVRPSHLFKGTRYINMQDMVLKGRQANGLRNGSRTHPELLLRGSKHPQSKLTEKKVLKIRKLYASGNYLQLQLGLKFKVSDVMISRIVRRKEWCHI